MKIQISYKKNEVIALAEPVWPQDNMETAFIFSANIYN